MAESRRVPISSLAIVARRSAESFSFEPTLILSKAVSIGEMFDRAEIAPDGYSKHKLSMAIVGAVDPIACH